MITYLVNPKLSDADLNHLFASAWQNYKPSSFQKKLQHSLSYIAAYSETQLVGFVNIAWDGGSHTFLLDTTVRESFQKQGIGKGLVHKAISVCKEHAIEWIHVDFEPHLLNFYKDCGFRTTEAGLINLKSTSL